MEPTKKTPLDKTVTNLVIFFILTGVFGIIFGFVHFRAFISTQAEISLFDMIFNASHGIILLICGYFTSKRKSLVLWILGFDIVLTQLYSSFVGRGFNLVLFMILAVVFVMLIQLINMGKLRS